MTAIRPGLAAALLRTIAVAIAIAAVVDPAVKTAGAGRARLAVVTTQPASPVADRVRAQLIATLGASHDIVPQITSDSAAAIVIGDRYPDETIAADLPVATVTIAASPTPPVRIVSVSAPREVPAGTAIRVDAELEAVGTAGTSADFTVSIGGLEVGRVSHQLRDERERWRAALDVVPVGEPPWIVHAAVTQPDNPGLAATNIAQTVVGLRRDPLTVQIYEPRPSWATTFVRRALESDARFRVESLSVSSRGVAARTPGSAALFAPELDSLDVIIVGGLDRLSAAEGRALDRFMRERGGAVVLVPDARVDAAPARELMPLKATERLLERPATLSMKAGAAPIDASELLLFPSPAGVEGEVVATAADGSPIVLSVPRGRGRLFISGAMDAWRYRASADRGFDRFWQAAIAALALAAPPPIDVRISPPVLRPLERGVVSVRLRSDAAAVSASVDDETIRLWPESEAGAYRGIFTARKTPGRMSIEITTEGDRPHTAARDVVVQEGVEAPVRSGVPLSLLAASRRGIDVTPERLDDLERFVRSAINVPRAAGVTRPLRSTWWMLPFGACLAAEWWLRRRRGHR